MKQFIEATEIGTKLVKPVTILFDFSNKVIALDRKK